MAALRVCLSNLSNFISHNALPACSFQQTRNYFGCRMRRDARRRQLAGEFAPARLRMVAMKRNDILPIELREAVEKEFQEKIPRQSALRQLTQRCVFTSRPRGNAIRWRLSRLVFRDLADHNQLAGIERAMW